jgi:DAACS family dicarboxylate/amino acid:cation (Na+ or H+) symporter
MTEPQRHGMSLHTKILLGLVVGATAGMICRSAGWVDLPVCRMLIETGDFLGQVFLRLVTMVVLPLIVSALVLGVAEIRDATRLGVLGLKTLGMTLLLSGTAVFLGVFLTDVIRPGTWISIEQRQSLSEQFQGQAQTAVSQAHAAKTVKQILLDVIPRNPLQEMVGAIDGSSPGGGLMAVMFFSVILGCALIRLGDRAAPLTAVLDSVREAMMVIVGWAMRLAPFAVAGLIFGVTARQGWSIMIPLLGFVGTVLLGLGIQMMIVYPLCLWRIGRRNPLQFFRHVSDALLTAFGTSSSSATLPTALRVANQNLRLQADESTFVLTIGATGNQNGTALYEGVVVLFLAQVFEVPLTFGQQIQVVLMSILAGVGTAGVPGGSLPMIVLVMESVGIPGAGIGIILGIDRILDMCRTVLNVAGDLTIAACVAAPETAVAREQAADSVANQNLRTQGE